MKVNDGAVTFVYPRLVYLSSLWYLKGNMHTISPGRNRVNFQILADLSPLTYSMALDAYHIDSVNTCYD